MWSDQVDDSLLSLFSSSDDILKLQNVMGEESFRQLAAEVNIERKRQDQLLGKFYRQDRKMDSMNVNPYYSAYLNWKEEKESGLDYSSERCAMQEKNVTSNSKTFFSLKEEVQKKREAELDRRSKQRLKQIKQEYERKFRNLLQDNNFKQQKHLQKQAKTKVSELSITKIEFPQIKPQKIEPSSRHIPYSSFQNIIKHPPRKNTDLEVYLPPQATQKSESQLQQNRKLKWVLDIDEILKLPHHQFLQFYSSYQEKLRSLCSVEEYKRLKDYRNTALEHEKAIYKLREKVTGCEGKTLDKLSPERKQKLFQLLYETELQKQRQKYIY